MIRMAALVMLLALGLSGARPLHCGSAASVHTAGSPGAPAPAHHLPAAGDAHAAHGQPGERQFPIGATRWLIPTVGYGYTLTAQPASARPFAEVQYNRVAPERGGIQPEALFGHDSFWSLTFGVRLFFGGDPMRMGSYGVLDPMSVEARGMPLANEVGGHAGH